MSDITISQAAASSATANWSATAHPSEYLIFTLGAESYGIDIQCVQEIRPYEDPTSMPVAPDFIKGVINIREVIVPIIDMRIKFGMPEAAYGAFTAVIVINVGSSLLGMVVDSVSYVISLTPEQMHPVPEFVSCIINNHIRAIGSLQEQDQMLVLLDIERLMSSAEMGLIAGAASEGQAAASLPQ